MNDGRNEVHTVSRRWPAWVVPALALGLLATGLYGYNQQSQRSAALAVQETRYQGSFHNVVYDVHEMQNALSRATVTREPAMIGEELRLAERHAVSAQAHAAELPGMLMPDGAVQAELGRIVEQAESLQAGHADGSKLSGADIRQVQRMTAEATQLTTTLRTTQATWMGKPHVFTDGQGRFLHGVSTSVGRGFEKIDGVSRALLAHNDGPFAKGASTTHTHGTGIADTGPVVTEAVAIEHARKFVGMNDAHLSATAQKLGPGYAWQGYIVTLDAGGAQATHAVVSLHRGTVLWMNRVTTSVGVQRLSMHAAEAKARTFLTKHGIGHIRLMESGAYYGHAAFSFAPVVQGAAVYTQPIRVGVNLHDGQIVRYDASEYLTNALPIVSTAHRITPQMAVRNLAPGFRVENTNLAVMELPNHKPTLVYDLLGRSSNGTYHVYVDAVTGRQVGIDKLTP